MEEKTTAKKIKRPKSLYKRLHEKKGFLLAETIFLPVLLGVIICILWQTQILHKILGADTFTLPLLSRIIRIFSENISEILRNSGATLIVAGAGLVLGSLLGYGMAILGTFFPRMGKGGLSILGAVASIPIVALAPVINNWTKSVSTDAFVRSMVAKTIVVMLIAGADMCLNAYRGLTELQPYALDLMATFAAKKGKTLFKLRIPNSLPYVFTALKVSVPASIMTAIVSEYFAEYIIGVGRQIRENIVLAQYSTAWAYIAAACIIGVIAYALLMVLQSILLRKYSK